MDGTKMKVETLCCIYISHSNQENLRYVWLLFLKLFFKIIFKNIENTILVLSEKTVLFSEFEDMFGSVFKNYS